MPTFFGKTDDQMYLGHMYNAKQGMAGNQLSYYTNIYLDNVVQENRNNLIRNFY